MPSLVITLQWNIYINVLLLILDYFADPLVPSPLAGEGGPEGLRLAKKLWLTGDVPLVPSPLAGEG
jgi:hypothetical protein